MNDYTVSVIENVGCAEKTYRMRLACPELAAECLPGQFINLRVADSVSPLLRRPFSIHRVDSDKKWFEILFDVRGQGTQKLSQLEPGDVVSAIGPLGNTFEINERKPRHLFVAGGLGIAPFLYLAESLQNSSVSTTGFYGVRTKAQLCCLDEFAAAGTEMHISTEDGSEGYRGYITDPLETYLATKVEDIDTCVISACGPPAMLRKVQAIAGKRGIEAQLSLETYMACGIGICVGCAVERKHAENFENKYQLVCKNGPVFRAEEVVIPD